MPKEVFIILLVSLTVHSLAATADLAEPILAGDAAVATHIQTWPVVSAVGGAEQREWKPAGPVFGAVARRVLGSFSKDKRWRIDALLLDAGTPEAAGADVFRTEFTQLRATLPQEVTSKFGVNHVAEKPAPSAAPGAEVLVWDTATVQLRLMYEPGRRVWMTIQPVAGSAKPAAAATKGAAAQAQAQPPALEAKVKRLPNGDVLIDELPAIEETPQNSYDGLSAAQMVQKHFGWDVDVEAVIKKLHGGAGGDPADILLFKELALQAKARARVVLGFDFADVKREIDKGHLVVAIKGYRRERQDFLVAFAQKFKADPTLELPSPLSKEDSAKWAWHETADTEVDCVINGYNAKRGEVIISQPGWTSEHHHLRLRPEEMKASTEQMIIFSAR